MINKIIRIQENGNDGQSGARNDIRKSIECLFMYLQSEWVHVEQVFVSNWNVQWSWYSDNWRNIQTLRFAPCKHIPLHITIYEVNGRIQCTKPRRDNHPRIIYHITPKKREEDAACMIERKGLKLEKFREQYFSKENKKLDENFPWWCLLLPPPSFE